MIGDDIAWENRDGILGDRELSGTPVHTLGALDAEHLPLYLRIDLGVRHSVPVRAPRGTLTLFASLDNALARENATALVLAGARDRTRPIPMVPFSVVAGLSWRY